MPEHRLDDHMRDAELLHAGRDRPPDIVQSPVRVLIDLVLHPCEVGHRAAIPPRKHIGLGFARAYEIKRELRQLQCMRPATLGGRNTQSPIYNVAEAKARSLA